jgi:hypothetical protein
MYNSSVDRVWQYPSVRSKEDEHFVHRLLLLTEHVSQEILHLFNDHTGALVQILPKLG